MLCEVGQMIRVDDASYVLHDEPPTKEASVMFGLSENTGSLSQVEDKT